MRFGSMLLQNPYRLPEVPVKWLDDKTYEVDTEQLDTVTLDRSDPFERVLIDMVETNRRKRSDYAVDGSPFSNFDETSSAMGIDGFTATDSARFNVAQKLARLRSLSMNGRLDEPANESVTDTYLDLAVYSVIMLAIHRYPNGSVA